MGRQLTLETLDGTRLVREPKARPTNDEIRRHLQSIRKGTVGKTKNIPLSLVSNFEDPSIGPWALRMWDSAQQPVGGRHAARLSFVLAALDAMLDCWSPQDGALMVVTWRAANWRVYERRNGAWFGVQL